MPFIIVGLTTGAVYGMAATGLVLTYKTSGIFNFAHGAIGTVAAYAYFELTIGLGLPWPFAVAITVLVVGPLLGLGLERVARRLSVMSTAMKVVGTLGLVLATQGLASLLYGTSPRLVPQFLPTDGFTVAGTTVGYDQVIIIVISLAVTGVLRQFIESTRYGAAMRGVVDDPDLLASYGVNPASVRRTSWLIGSTFAALSGVLLLPAVGLDALVLTLLIVQAFGAAAIGFFSSLSRTFAGGLAVGVAVSIATAYAATDGPLAGLPSATPFIVLFLVLVLTPARRLATHGLSHLSRPRPQPVWRAPAPFQIGGGAVLCAVLLAVPYLVGTKLPFYINAMAGVVMFLSLGLLVRTSKQISLAHMGFAAIGAAAFAHLAGGAGVPWPLALLLAGLIAVPVGAAVAVPAIRLSSLFLALATFGFGLMIEQMFYTSDLMFGATSLGLNAPRPSIGGLDLTSDRAFYYVCLLIALLAAAGVLWLHRSRFGRLLSGLGDAPVALNTLGTNTNVTRLMVFCLSAFLAAVSGGLTASAATNIGSGAFPSFESLTLVVLLALMPQREPWYAFAAAFALYIVPSFFTGIAIDDWLTVLFGVGAVYTAMTAELSAATSPLRAGLDRFRRVRPRPPVPDGDVPIRERTPMGGDRSGLEVDRLTVRFGGVVAVADLSLKAPLGQITGLIGPNGAGKTTTFNACSGLVRPGSGRITLGGRNLSRLSPSARARLGLGRTFQRIELFDSLTVAANVALGAEAVKAGANPLTQLTCSPAERERIGADAAEAMRLCGVAELADVQAGVLTTGQRRLVELARCLAGPYDLLLLDEPSAGLDDEETRRFGAVLRQVVTRRGVGLLLVEHDMSLVMTVCDYLYVLDFGRLVERGTPKEIAASPVVRDAYLGSDRLMDEIEPEVTSL
jgi:ABC-type branched-subunit amino acid transport system ATPase component/branched-subunit amino acid ABC-type transport system permease component